MRPCTIDIYLHTIKILLHITGGRIEVVNGKYAVCDKETGLPIIAELDFLPKGFQALGYNADGETLEFVLNSIINRRISVDFSILQR